MRLIDAEKLEKTLESAITVMEDLAKAIGVEDDEGVRTVQKSYKDILDGVKKEETIQAIPAKWVEEYADWLTTIPAPFAANDERSIRAMLTKWKTNPDLPQVGCSEDACEIGG